MATGPNNQLATAAKASPTSEQLLINTLQTSTAVSLARPSLSQASTLPTVPGRLLAALLEQVQPVDFRALLGITDPADQLRQSDYVIGVVQEVLRLAARNRWALAACEWRPLGYLYDGAGWYGLNEPALSGFLTAAAHRMGATPRWVRRAGFRKLLLRQFWADVYLLELAPAPTSCSPCGPPKT